MTALAVSGWVAAVALAAVLLLLRSRLELVARAEHELRGPLTVMSLCLEAMRREAGKDAADSLRTHLDRAMGGLDDLAAARTGRRSPTESERVELDGFVRHVVGAWQPVAARAGRRVQVEWEAGATTVHADRRRLAQTLGNLLANAVEHGEGSVRVLGRARRDRVEVEVADRGPGFATKPRAGHPGRGHGLSIAKRAAEDVGGGLAVSSHEGRGVVVELPVDRQ